MKKSPFAEEQIAYALTQVRLGIAAWSWLHGEHQVADWSTYWRPPENGAGPGCLASSVALLSDVTRPSDEER